MKTRSRIYIALLLSAALFTTGCDPDVEIPGQENIDSYTSIYMPQAEGGVKSKILTISDDPQVIYLGAAYGGFSYPSQDIEVTFKVDPAAVASYNTVNNTAYAMLPKEVYSLSGTTAVIPSGKTSSSVLKLMLNTKAMTPFISYLIAIQIEQVTGNIKLNEKLRTAYFIIKTQPDNNDYAKLDRTKWTVVDRSSEEPKEATWGNGGLVVNTFDDDEDTFWHTKWDGGEPPPPHWFIIDMGETKNLHGFYFLGRQSGNTSGRFKDVVVETSMDGSTWKEAGSFTLEDTGDEQHAFLSTGFGREARYFKITINKLYEGVAYSHLAELNAF